MVSSVDICFSLPIIVRTRPPRFGQDIVYLKRVVPGYLMLMIKLYNY